MSDLIEQIKADREAGTPAPWFIPDQTYTVALTVETGAPDGSQCPGSGGAMSYTHEVCSLAWSKAPLWEANARRIARVPDMEAALLAAEELADSLTDPVIVGTEDEQQRVAAALAAYRKATA